MRIFIIYLPRSARAIWPPLTLLVLLLVYGSSPALAQPRGEVIIYPSSLRIEKGKTANVTAVAYDYTGAVVFNNQIRFKLDGASVNTASVRHAPIGNTEGATSRGSGNMAEIAALEKGTVSLTASFARLKPAQVTVTVVDPADPPRAVISGENIGNTLYIRPGQPIDLSAENSTGARTIEWNWGDGDRTTGMLSATHSYLYPGVYLIELKVTNMSGASSVTARGAIVEQQPIVTRTFTARTIAELMQAYNQCTGGEEIIIPAGTVLKGQIVLQPRAFTEYVTIRSSSLADMGSRASPTVGDYAVIQGTFPNETPFVMRDGVNHVRLSGLKFDPFPVGNDVTQNYYLLQIGELSTQVTSVSNGPHDIIIDHCLINPPDNIQVVHAIANNGYKVAIISSWIGNVKTYGGQDSQAVFALNGRGAHVYNNDYFEAASESVIYGGAPSNIDGSVPTDVEFRRCVFTKRLSWRTLPPNSVGETINEKNLFEIKNGRRIYIEGSLFSDHWDAGRSQYSAIVLKSTADIPGGGQGNAWSRSEDIVFENDRLSHANGAFGIAPEFDRPGIQYDALKPRNVKFANMLFDDVTFGRWGSERGWAISLGGVDDLTLDHITIVDNIDTPDESHELLLYLSTISSYRLSITDSILPLNYYGISDSCGEGTNALNVGTSGWFDVNGDSCRGLPSQSQNWTFTGNVLPKMRSQHNPVNYPTANFYPTDYSFVQMVGYRRCGISPASDPCDLPISAYRLSDASVYKRQAGTDPGINVDVLTERLKCTASGETRPCVQIQLAEANEEENTP
jgi:hypothetical protein